MFITVSNLKVGLLIVIIVILISNLQQGLFIVLHYITLYYNKQHSINVAY